MARQAYVCLEERKLEEDGLIEAIGEWRLPNGRISKRYEVTEEPVRKALKVVARWHDPSLFDP
jgi:DNA-binding PadR family transcriptional regulator